MKLILGKMRLKLKIIGERILSVQEILDMERVKFSNFVGSLVITTIADIIVVKISTFEIRCLGS